MTNFDHPIIHLAQEIVTLGIKKHCLVATAESCTGGLVSGAITEISGSSAMFDRGFVTYSNSAKIDLLGVEPETLQQFGAVSLETAREMALGALGNSVADLAVSITGIAGPGGSEHKPAGLVCFGLAVKSGTVEVIEQRWGDIGRANVRNKAIKQALELIRLGLEGL